MAPPHLTQTAAASAVSAVTPNPPVPRLRVTRPAPNQFLVVQALTPEVGKAKNVPALAALATLESSVSVGTRQPLTPPCVSPAQYACACA